MIDLMSFFGYVKVPKAAVRLSILNEYAIEKMVKNHSVKGKKIILEQLLENTKAITGFLRSGRLLE